MTTPHSPDHPLMKEAPEYYPQLSPSKLGKELYGSNVSYAMGEHPTAFRCLIGTILIIAISICVIVYYSVYSPSDDAAVFCLFLLLFSIIAICIIIVIMSNPVTSEILKTPDDALFFLKLIAVGHSWDEVGRIMNSYLFERGIWWTRSYIYDGKQCYDLFVSYSKSCSDPFIEPFIEQAKSKVAESMTLEWDRIQVPGHS